MATRYWLKDKEGQTIKGPFGREAAALMAKDAIEDELRKHLPAGAEVPDYELSTGP